MKEKLKKIPIIYSVCCYVRGIDNVLGNKFKNFIMLLKYMLTKKKIRIKKGVIYTCVTGGYDTPKIHKYYSQEWDYIYFTDDIKLINKKKIGMWQVRAIEKKEELNNHYLNRWYKMFPYKTLSEYEISLYIDGNIRIMSKEFYFDIQKGIDQKKGFMSTVHPLRNCIYKEAKACIKLKKDTPSKILEQTNGYKIEGFPKNFGLHDASILLRNHRNKKMKELMELWWQEIRNKSKRDQMSLTYCIWKLGLNINYINKKSYRYQKEKIRIECHK